MKELIENGLLKGFAYDKSHDALIGDARGYTVAVRENSKTASYGCLLWVRKNDYGTADRMAEKLKQMMASGSNGVKNFRTTDRGVAVALTKTESTEKNAEMIKNALDAITGELAGNDYVNCCYDCGATSGLSVYDSSGVLIQACGSCGAKYSLVMKPEMYLPKEEPSAAQGTLLPDNDALKGVKELGEEKEALFTAMATAAASLIEEKPEDAVSMEDLLADSSTESPVADDRTEIKTSDDLADFSEFMIDTSSDAAKSPSISFETPEREEPLQINKNEGSGRSEPDVDLSDLLFVESDGQSPQLAVKDAQQLKVGFDERVAVTELHDDSNEGEDIEITEYKDNTDYGEDFDISTIDSYVNKPTRTNEGKRLEARETPLEADGSVPLINPTSDFVDRAPSAVDGEDAVVPFEMRESIGGGAEMRSVGSKGTRNRPAAAVTLNKDVPSAGDYPRSPEIPPEVRQYPEPQHVSRISFGSNVAFGIVGALVLGVLGVVIWSFFTGFSENIPGRIGGYISAIGCLAIIAGVFGGYYIGGDELDDRGVAISALLTIILDIAGLAVRYMTKFVSGIAQMGYNISLLDSIEWVIYAFTEGENRTSLYLDLGINVIMMIVVFVITLTYIKKHR